MYITLGRITCIGWVLFLLMAFRREMGSSWKHVNSHLSKLSDNIWFTNKAHASFLALRVMISTKKRGNSTTDFFLRVKLLFPVRMKKFPHGNAREKFFSEAWEVAVTSSKLCFHHVASTFPMQLRSASC